MWVFNEIGDEERARKVEKKNVLFRFLDFHPSCEIGMNNFHHYTSTMYYDVTYRSVLCIYRYVPYLHKLYKLLY